MENRVMKRHSWKEKRKEGYKTIQECINCGCLRSRGTVKMLMAIVGSKDYYKYESVWKYTTLNGTTIKAPKCLTQPAKNKEDEITKGN